MEIRTARLQEFPSSVTVGDTVVVAGLGYYFCKNGLLDPAQCGIGYYVPRNLAIGSLSASSERRWFAWTEATRASPCSVYGPATIHITKEMWDMQYLGASMFVYPGTGQSRNIIGGCSDRVTIFRVAYPEVVTVPGRVMVATKRRGYEVLVDDYDNGRLVTHDYDWGGCMGSVTGRNCESFWDHIRYIRLSYFDSLSQNERDWLISKGVKVVDANWSPMSGEPKAICTLTGEFTKVPSAIPIQLIPGWGVRLAVSELPVGFTFGAAGCAYLRGGSVTPPATISSRPVTYSVNDIKIAELINLSGLIEIPGMVEKPPSFDLATYFSTWAAALTRDVKDITLKASIPAQTIGEFQIQEAYEKTVKIPVIIAECSEGDTVSETCWDGSTIVKQMCVNGELQDTTETCPPAPEPEPPAPTPEPPTPTPTPEPPAPPKCTEGTFKNEHICPDGSRIYLEKCVGGEWVESGQKCPTAPVGPKEGDKRLPVTCRDGSVIHHEVFVEGTWIPSGEACPEKIPRRTMMAAVPKIMYAGQAVDIVCGAYIGAAPSTDETAILTIDGTEVSRMNTKAGEVKFRWTAEGVGMHNLCVTIPPNVNLPTPGRVCKTIMVSADIGSIKEQVKREMESYRDELETLRKKKQLAREELKKYVAPGQIDVPASLAGSIIEIGGIVRTVPPGGMTIPISAGAHQVVVVVEGIRKLIPVIVLPGEEVMLL